MGAPPSRTRGIAARVRGLIGGQDSGDLAATAKRLGVTETALRRTVDPSMPTPALDVLAAIVNEYGVDPHWLLCGEYDVQIHRTAIASGHRTTPVDLVALSATITERDRREA